MDFCDADIMCYINHFSQHSWLFDKIMQSFSSNGLLKGAVVVTIIWSIWFTKNDQRELNRERIITTLFACVVAIALARGLALALPFRLRPLHDQGLHFVLPYGSKATILDGWSSFPSDHAALFFAISTGLFFIVRTVGVFALLYSLFFIAVPRIYLGLHYPTDIAAGAIIGIVVAALANKYLLKSKPTQLIINLSTSKPHLFYPAFFLCTYQIADMFNSSRDLLGGMVKCVNNILG